MTSRTVVAVSGALVVVAYAALLAVGRLVLEPLAAVPGQSLAAIYAHVDAVGNSTQQDLIGVLVTAAIGAALGILVSVVGLANRLPARVVAQLHLGVLAAGALAVFQTGWFLGMDLADAFAIGGEVHAGVLLGLYDVSLAAVVAILVLVVVTAVQTARRTRAASTMA